jgi:antitoxin (DNA-binding transcriptional repressor) of toxin-antitoxin stability system
MLAGMKTLDAAKMAGDFPRFLGRVVSRQESYEIVKEGVPCAYLVPAGERKCNSRELAEDIAGTELAPEDRRALSSAVRRGRKVFKPLKNPWG